MSDPLDRLIYAYSSNPVGDLIKYASVVPVRGKGRAKSGLPERRPEMFTTRKRAKKIGGK